jgi:uncharacterized protein YjbI with pentapeptide repeats
LREEGECSSLNKLESRSHGSNCRSFSAIGANFRGTYLSGANLQGTDIRAEDLDGAYLVGAILPDGTSAGQALFRNPPLTHIHCPAAQFAIGEAMKTACPIGDSVLYLRTHLL